MKKTKVLWIIMAAIILVNIIIYLAKPGGEIILLYVSNLLPVLCSIIATVFIFLAVRSLKSFDFTKIAWMLMLLGLILYVFAETIYGIIELGFTNLSLESPGIADYFWCLGYIPIFVGLLMMLIGYKKSGLPLGKTSYFIILSVIILTIVVLTIFFLMIPAINNTESIGLAKIFNLFYPIADLFVIIPAVFLIYITSLFGSAFITKPWKYLTLGFVLFTISDLLYYYLELKDMYGSGNLIDLGWNSGYLLFAMSGYQQYLLVKSLN